MSFEKLNINREITKILEKEGITTPTDIQAQTIPVIKEGKDIIGVSKTGSGKTLAFALPLIEMIRPKEGLQVIVLAPTRELAVQISKEFIKFSKPLKLNVAVVFGGVSINPQIEAIRKSEIIVATPGRTLDHLQRRTLDLGKIRFFVIDEADKMVDMGFIIDITKIIRHTPKSRQMLLFGATIEDQISKLKKEHMNNPIIIKSDAHVSQDMLQQFYYNVKQHKKFSLLVHLLNKKETERTIVFCSTINTVELVTRNLKRHKFDVEMIHGKLSQHKRMEVMDQFNKGKPNILIASAVAARGLHIGSVSHVINYDVSQDPEEYIHRIGRTARAGESGVAITLLSERDHDAFSSVLRRFDINVELLPNEDFPDISFDAGRQRRMNFGRDRYPRRGNENSNRQGTAKARRPSYNSQGSSRRSPRSGDGTSRGKRSYSREGSSGERRSSTEKPRAKSFSGRRR